MPRAREKEMRRRSCRPSRLVLLLVLAAFSPAGAQDTPPAAPLYLIGPEDVLSLSVWRETELSVTVPVRPDGRISAPLVGEVEVAGRTPVEVQQAIEDRLVAFLTARPTVTVIVSEVNSRKIYILGQVAAPGVFDLRRPLSALQAIALAGGLTEFADQNGILVISRQPEGQETRRRFDYKRAVSEKGSGEDIQLQPGDIIHVP
jgi:polysaccharide export outer membrane protein